MRGWGTRLATCVVVICLGGVLSGCSLTAPLASADGTGGAATSGTPSASQVAAVRTTVAAQAYAMVVRADLQDITSYSGSCQDLSEEAYCVAAARTAPAAISNTLNDLAHLPVPSTLTADNTQLVSELHLLLAAATPVVTARGRDAEAEADSAFAFTDQAVTSAFGSVEDAASA